MGDLFNRDFLLKLAGVPLPVQMSDPFQTDKASISLKVTFNVEKNSNKDPNRAEVTIYNLNPANRRTLQQGNLVAQARREPPLTYEWPLEIEAGYVGSIEGLFKGNITFANSRKESTTWVTDIECGDGEDNYRSARMSKSYGPGTPVIAVIYDAIVVLGIGPGNLSVLTAIAPRKVFTTFKKGVSVSGQVVDILDKYVSSMGFQWSIQDGQLQFLRPKQTTLEEVVLLTKETGLIGSPEQGEDGTVTVKSLLQGKLKPGRRVVIKSQMVVGMFKIDKVNHYGDTWGGDWYSEVEAKPV